MAVIKLFTTILRFVDAEYYRCIESVLNELEMAFSGIAVMLYIIDILYYTVIDDNWGNWEGEMQIL